MWAIIALMMMMIVQPARIAIYTLSGEVNTPHFFKSWWHGQMI